MFIRTITEKVLPYLNQQLVSPLPAVHGCTFTLLSSSKGPLPHPSVHSESFPNCSSRPVIVLSSRIWRRIISHTYYIDQKFDDLYVKKEHKKLGDKSSICESYGIDYFVA